jgi:hypothetical protein
MEDTQMVAFANDSATIQRLLSAVERMIVEARERQQAELNRLEGQRDRLLLLLTDLEGAHDQRFVAVR